jgi:hypothetical protein
MSGQDIAGPMTRVHEKQAASACTTKATFNPPPGYSLLKRSTLQQEMRNAPLQYIIVKYK